MVGRGGERKVQKGGDACLHIADLFFCIAQTNKTL